MISNKRLDADAAPFCFAPGGDASQALRALDGPTTLTLGC
jgi:hypothetical protein